MNRKSNYLLLCSLVLCLWSCKEQDFEPMVNENTNDLAIASPLSAVPTNSLDWESIDYMPTVPGQSVIPVPWASSASRQMTFEMANDYKKANGWELVYSTFSTQVIPDKYYFVLYNKYSGLLRMYLYVTNSNFIHSVNVVQTLEFEGSYAPGSPLLNFSDQLIVDVNQNSLFASSIEKAQVAPNTWYAFEHELAYDQNLTNQTSFTAFFKWPVRAAQITEVKLNGNIDGSLDGNISIPGINFSVASSINTTNNSAGNGTIKLTGDADKNDLSALGQAFFSGAKKALEKAGLSQVEGILGGIFGKNSNGSTDNVNLKLDATIDVQGSLESNFLLSSPAIAVPSVDNTNIAGHLPAYDKALGVFYISNRPTILEKKYIIRQYDQSGQEIYPRYQYVYDVVDNSFNMIFNPEVLAIADISNIQKEVIVVDKPYVQIDAGLENIGGNYYQINSIVSIPEFRGTVIGSRISFDVVPKDGSPKITITKTFKSNMSFETIWQDGDPGPGDDIPIDFF